MKITRITIKNFRTLRDVDLLELNNTVLLAGLNGQGKTSVQAAVQMCLFGFCAFTNRGGAGADKLIRDGAKSADISVSLQVDNPEHPEIEVSCTIHRRENNEWLVMDTATGEVLTDLKNRDDLWRWLAIDKKHAQVCAMPAMYVGSSDLDDVLADFISGGVTREAVLAAAGDNATWLAEFATRKSCSLTSAPNLTALGKSAAERRRDINSEIKEAELECDLLKGTRAPRDGSGKQLGVSDLDRIKAGVQQCDTKLQDVLVALGRAQAVRPAADVAAERSALQDRLVAARQEEQDIAERAKAARDAVTQAEEHWAAARQADSNKKDEYRRLERDLKQAEASLASLNGEDGACPTCKQKYSAKTRKALLEPLEALAATAREQLEQCRQDCAAALNALAPAHRAVKTAVDTRDGLESKLRLAQRTIAEIEAAMGTLAPAASAGDPVALQAEVDQLREKLDRGRGLVETLEKLAKYEAAARRLELLEAEKEPLQWAVTALRDGELLKSLVKDDMGAFVARCNKELGLFGITMDIEVKGKHIGLLVQTADKDFRPVTLCSEGEKVLVQFAVAMAFAGTGAPVLLDDLNHLDHAWRKRVLMRLKDHAEDGSVLLAAAWQQSGTDMDAVAKALAPITVVWAEQGELNIRGQVAAVA